MTLPIEPGLLAAIAVVAVLLGLLRAVAVGRPDEWLLLIRDGYCVRAGVGIVVLRRPFDTVARFTSTVQRVSFTATVLTRDLVEATVEGYVLWSISPEDGGPFTAFQRLGLGSHSAGGGARHLLARPQHRAFQTAFAAAAQARAAGFDFGALALEQEQLTAQLQADAGATLADLGARVDEVQIVQVRASEAVQADLTAPASQRIREAAETERVASDQRLRALRADAETAAARRETESRRARESLRIAADLALEAERQRLAEAQAAREDVALDARLARQDRETRADVERQRLRLAVAEQKSDAQRAYELERLRTERFADALQSLPIKDARWYTLGSPVNMIADLLEREH